MRILNPYCYCSCSSYAIKVTNTKPKICKKQKNFGFQIHVPHCLAYANGCFEFDIYFPADYPNTPMLVNLETTGNRSVRFNPNLVHKFITCFIVLIDIYFFLSVR